ARLASAARVPHICAARLRIWSCQESAVPGRTVTSTATALVNPAYRWSASSEDRPPPPSEAQPHTRMKDARQGAVVDDGLVLLIQEVLDAAIDLRRLADRVGGPQVDEGVAVHHLRVGDIVEAV